MAASLNERQRDLLRRIADGHRPDSDEAASVYALRSRGFVTTRSAYAYDTAEITEAGRRLLAGADPEPPPVRRPAPVVADSPARDDGVPRSANELLSQLAEHGGKLVVPDPPERQRAAWRRLLHATREQQAGGDQIIRHTGRDSGDLVMWLEARETEPAKSATVEPVPIPDRVVRPHPLIAALRDVVADRDGWLDTRHTPGVVHVRIHRDRRTRAIRLLHALVTEAARRGYTIGLAKEYRCPGGLGIIIDGHPLEITVHEESKRIPHELTADEQRRQERGQYVWAPKWDFVPTGRLVLRYGHDSYGGRNLAADRTRWILDDRLAHVLRRLEELAVKAEARRVENERREAEREHQQQLELEAAERRRIHQLRVEHLDDQLDQWRHAQEIRAFAAAAADTDDPDAVEWLAWAARYADSIDPLVAGSAHRRSPSLRRGGNAMCGRCR